MKYSQLIMVHKCSSVIKCMSCRHHFISVSENFKPWWTLYITNNPSRGRKRKICERIFKGRQKMKRNLRSLLYRIVWEKTAEKCFFFFNINSVNDNVNRWRAICYLMLRLRTAINGTAADRCKLTHFMRERNIWQAEWNDWFLSLNLRD